MPSKTFDKEFWSVFLVLASVFLGITVVNLNENFREKVRDFIISDQRKILAKAIGDLTGNSTDTFTVLKVQDRDSLAIEVYQNLDNGKKTNFRARYILPEKREGYFSYQGNAVNLVLMDINVDGKMEILTSAYDDNLVPRMHVLQFDNDRIDFEELGPDSVKL